MNLMKTPLEKAAGALEVCNRRLAGFESERATKAAQAEAETAFDAGFMIREEVAVLDRKIAAAIIARDHEARNFELAQAAAKRAEDDVEERRIRKLNADLAKLTVDLGADAEKYAAKLQRHVDMLAEVAGWNTKRGPRLYIVDGEAKVRGTPACEVPAVTRREKAWVDANGNRPSQLVERNGQLVPAGLSGDYTFREIEVVERPARIEPARMAERLADAIRLVDLHGRQIWPPHA